ncbi:MAG: histidine phosphatase family protein, partial [Rhizobacter sp.]|nr:histidine phosphatase family protein [Rhizobacter sp.]
DLVRASATAAAIADVVGLPVTTDTGLRERGFGIFQGWTYAEIDARWPDAAARWRLHDPTFAPEGGESLVDFDVRAVAALTRIAEAARGRTIAVVTHGGVLDCLYRAATGLALAAPRSWQLANAAINRVLFTGERFTLVGWSDTAHLEDGTLDDASEGDCPTVPRAAA